MNSRPNILGIPARLGLGTAGLGELSERRDQEVAAVRFALDTGYRVIDTAEWYGAGGAEKIIGTALSSFGRDRRSEVFLMSKVFPENATLEGTIRACEASVERLGSGYIDLYLLHWRGPHDFKDTLQAFNTLRERKLIRHFGVSNFDVDDLIEWRKAEKRMGLTDGATANEISYRLNRRGIEYGQLEWHRAHGFATIGYGPLGQGELPQHPVIKELAAKRGITPAQIILAWCLRIPDLISIPKSITPSRIKDNFGALQIELTPEELQRIDQAFPLKHRWIKGNPLLRFARSTARKVVRKIKPPPSRTVQQGAAPDHS